MAAFPAHAYANPGAPAGFVNDFAGMLNPPERTLLEAKLSSFAIDSKHEISVVTIPSLGSDTVENFAEKLFKDWGIGKTGADNGVLLLIARDDRKFRIEVGYGLEGALTDAQSYWILQNILTPAFKNGEYAAGLANAVDKIIDATRGEVIPSSGRAQNGNGGGVSVDWFWIVFAIPMWLASIFGRSKSWWLGGVVGGVAGAVLGSIFGFLYWGVTAIAILTPLGLLFDYIVSHKYAESVATHHRPPWWIGGGRGPLGGGGFGGFGGGRSGGGGASGGW
ncbi:MAG: TPM domain-containing protein [Candidatus Liptonbacteria bacterium]|nr:TPM domain-containing protein [Candidatus Liptonbacteria bacterium]